MSGCVTMPGSGDSVSKQTIDKEILVLVKDKKKKERKKKEPSSYAQDIKFRSRIFFKDGVEAICIYQISRDITSRFPSGAVIYQG